MSYISQYIGLYEICYAFILLFAIYHYYPLTSYWQKGLVYIICLLIFNPVNPLIQTRWQITLGYFATIIIIHYFQTRSFEKTLVLTTHTYINLFIVDSFYLVLAKWIPVEWIIFYGIFLISACLLIWGLAYIEHKIVQYILDHWSHRKYALLIFSAMICILLLGPAVYQVSLELSGESKEITQFILAINLTLFILFIVGGVILYYGLGQIKKAERQLANQKINQEYSSMISQQYTKMRRFRHDYKNVLLSLEGLIREESWTALKSYFFKELASGQGAYDLSNDQLSRLVYIQNPEIRMIFYSKLSYALSQQIELQIEVSESLPKLDQHLMALSRMLGIILDNAIEESQKYSNAKIQVVLTEVDQEVLIMVSNPTESHPSQVAKMNELGFSTKGQNRGYVLTNLKELANEANILLYTSIENKQFIQELYIPITTKEENV